ncbi:MAG: hypothetical protein FJZ78_09255 [Bacteroidetes bacterium]|nr:hypothetical protein [Bacteroidota bacterium]
MKKDVTDLLLREEVFLYHYFEEVMVRVDTDFNFYAKWPGKLEFKINATSDLALQALMGEDLRTKEEYYGF